MENRVKAIEHEVGIFPLPSNEEENEQTVSEVESSSRKRRCIFNVFGHCIGSF